MEKAPPGWPELDFVRDDGPFSDDRPHGATGWEVIVFELEDDEQPAEATTI